MTVDATVMPHNATATPHNATATPHNAAATAAQRRCYAAQRHCRPISLCAAVLMPLPSGNRASQLTSTG